MIGIVLAIAFGAPFADHMVLQRDRLVPIWGTANPGERVTVSFAGQSVDAVTDAKGNWRATLQPLKASAVGRELKASSRLPAQPSGHDGEGAVATLISQTFILSDVLVGEVWLAGGQSNMACPTWGPNPRFRDEQGMFMSQLTRLPLLRYATAVGNPSETPQTKLRYDLNWRLAVPENLTKTPFSAVAFYFGRELQIALGIPVGVVCAAEGGTNIDAWTPQCGYDGIAELADLAGWKFLSEESWRNVKVRKLPIDGYQQQPTMLWNGFLAPLAPMAARGVIWYQGERNCVAGEAGPRYAAKLRALYNGWSRAFANPDLKFQVVQLCSWGPDIVAFQETQRKFCADEPNARLAVINDLGDPKDIHPPRKEPVGRRLAALALKYDYGFKNLAADAPVLVSAVAEGAKVRLAFSSCTRLSLRTAARDTASGIELAGADGGFRPVTIENLRKVPVGDIAFGAIDGPTLIVSASGVTEPRRVRYLSAVPRVGTLMNECNLPVAAFDAEVTCPNPGKMR